MRMERETTQIEEEKPKPEPNFVSIKSFNNKRQEELKRELW